MANHFKTNAELLKKTVLGQAILNYLDTIAENRNKVKKIDGQEYFEEKGQYYLLHSTREREEATYLVKNIEKNRDYLLVVYGIGNVDLLEKLIDVTSENTKILIIEENIHIFRYCMYYKRLDNIFKNKKVSFTIGEKQCFDTMLRICVQSEWSNLIQNMKVITIPAYQIYHKKLSDKIQQMRTEFSSSIRALGNSTEDQMEGVTNNFLNVDACIRTNSIEEIRGKYKGLPGIVVASGPSLDKNIELLKETQGKAVIIACDASYQQCIKHGVKPDAIASIERIVETYDYFYKGKSFDKDLVFVGPGLVWPDILKEFPGKTILLSKTEDGADGWWRKHFENIEYVVMGMSCANVAHAVLKEAGCNPIILIGQDLAYTDDKQHSEDAHNVFKDDNIIKDDKKYLWTEDIYGNQVKTTAVFNLFRQYFEYQTQENDNLLIDATEGGAKIRGTKIMTFRDAIDQYCTGVKEKNMNEYLKDIPWSNQKAIEKYEEIIVSAKEFIAVIEDLEEKMRVHVSKIQKYNRYDFEHASREELVQCVLEMQEGNDLITYVTEQHRDLATFFGHVYKSAIMKVKKLGNELTAKAVEENWEIQIRLIYLMQIICKTVKEKYQEMIAFMEQKKESVQE